MPVYLCKPGVHKADPWRHGLEVWLAPYGNGNEWDHSIDHNEGVVVEEDHPNDVNSRRSHAGSTAYNEVRLNNAAAVARQGEVTPAAVVPGSVAGYIIRRVRHAEVVLVDEVVIRYGRPWLRLRWPGPRGGFAGYIDLGQMIQQKQEQQSSISSNSSVVAVANATTDNTIENNDEKDNENKHGTSTQCNSRGKYYPSYDMLKLLSSYDDGLDLDVLSPSSQDEKRTSSSTTDHAAAIVGAENTDVEDDDLQDDHASPSQLVTESLEPVFCRICREGLHDVEYETAAAAPDEAAARTSSIINNHSVVEDNPESERNNICQEIELEKRAQMLMKQFQSHPLSENPMLAPCECSGSMAFVHRLCVEEWRCRSRHPAARLGLNCETCGAAYSLPPPPLRPQDEGEVGGERVGMFGDDDWVDAMPAHVLAALRRPHPWWRFCAMVVRRKWLRPLAPIVCSPIVATYCRCRRMLKKRGVSRRRWACSLCRRRARWKCVRCLRSYYCSRQCQNVSWHIMHKHMCYKPVRIWWSSIFYGLSTIVLFPGIWKNPLVYWTSLLNVAVGFLVSSNLAGGIASVVKKVSRIDMRGRSLELAVVLFSIAIGYTNWGIVWGFFGHPDHCVGAFGVPFTGDRMSQHLLQFISFMLDLLTSFLHGFDRFVINYAFETKSLCSNELYAESNGTKCLQTPNASNPRFLYEEDGKVCASDIHVVYTIYGLAWIFMTVAYILKKTDRRPRVGGRRGAAARPHLD